MSIVLLCRSPPGMGDWSGFMDKIHEVVPMDQQPELLQKLSEGHFTLRIMYEQFQNILKMGPIGQVCYLLALKFLFPENSFFQ